ncbi:hypothetical protein SERLADRAFT_433759 [Serpula lacrymans var. lacrymans S7.9]|uniref:CCHC-type domain-containing protein n=1 Tax=Serpula lacrymans var. lacrymans (strain S7.9) TaxID=578457 RepID=F8NIP1_SERL9|nr:uncharacterized protein SERLADRAFT_433759 [Serpula lacrymans var. lacrymans S7.9]EGO29803.1 hypothetical protein SERLADRAFT_433759 [Serpula lacrymans var. lacrymans S7.9]
MVSKELLEILKCWSKPPCTQGTHNTWASGAKAVLEEFLFGCIGEVLEGKLQRIQNLAKCPPEDVSEEGLTSLFTEDLVLKLQSPGFDGTLMLWKLLQRLTRTESQEKRNAKQSTDLTQTATPPTSSRQGRIAAPPPFPQPDVTRLHTREQADTFYEARTRWLQFYAESHPQLIPRTQHDPPVTTENIYNEDDFEEYAAEGEPIPLPTPQILPTAPNPSPTPPTYTMSNATTPKPTMIGKIDDFDGTPDKAQRWISSTDLHFDINDTIYTSDKKKSEAKMTEYKDKNAYPTWADFMKMFTASFRTANVKGTASAALMKMRMEPGENAVAFNSMFMLDAGKSGINNEAMIMVYQKAIRPPLLRGALTGKELVTIEDWMNTVANLDANWISANTISEGTWGTRNKERQYNKNRKSGPSTSVKRLTKDKEETRRKEGRCFICNEKGHIGRNCKNKGKTPERKVRQTETEDDVKTVEEDKVQNIMRMWRELGEDQRAEAMKELEDEGF